MPLPPRPVILLVDDEPDILLLLRRYVQHLVPSATMIIAATGADALIQAQLQPLALAVVDFNMPGGIDGIAVAKALLVSQRCRRVLIVTAWHTPEVERAARAAGASYLPKPLDLDRFAAIIQAAL